MERDGGRGSCQLREVKVTKDFISHPEGSVLIEMGNTKVICSATVEESVPNYKKGTGEGWITGEYSMLPRATNTRNQRDIGKLKQNPRSVEIQRLIGRALRAGVDLKALGERSIIVDCDVIQADGGTRTASITGGFMALYLACSRMADKGILLKNPVKNFVAAVSAGIIKGCPLLDLCYSEDFQAEADVNIAMNDLGQFIEIQGTGESRAFSHEELSVILDYSKEGIEQLVKIQKSFLL